MPFRQILSFGCLSEAHIGQLAETQVSPSQFRDFGQKLTHNHTDAYQRLAALAAKTRHSVPTGIDVRKITPVEQLIKLKGPQFDRQFVQDEIREHERALAEFRREAKPGKQRHAA